MLLLLFCCDLFLSRHKRKILNAEIAEDFYKDEKEVLLLPFKLILCALCALCVKPLFSSSLLFSPPPTAAYRSASTSFS
jgi:hypothetical protein